MGEGEQGEQRGTGSGGPAGRGAAGEADGKPAAQPGDGHAGRGNGRGRRLEAVSVETQRPAALLHFLLRFTVQKRGASGAGGGQQSRHDLQALQ